MDTAAVGPRTALLATENDSVVNDFVCRAQRRVASVGVVISLLALIGLAAFHKGVLHMGPRTDLGTVPKTDMQQTEVFLAPGGNPSCIAAAPPLRGLATSVWNSMGFKYSTSGLRCYWDVPLGNYSWIATFNGASSTSDAENGWATYLSGPELSVDKSTGSWKIRSFIGARVDALNHSMCCCQYMAGDKELIVMTDYCRATVPGLSKSVHATCAPYMETPCPADNETASKMTFDTPMYTEVYSACMAPLPTGW